MRPGAWGRTPDPGYAPKHRLLGTTLYVQAGMRDGVVVADDDVQEGAR